MDGLTDLNTRLRALPQLQRLLETPEAHLLLARHPHAEVTGALRAVLAGARAELAGGGTAPDADVLVRDAGARLRQTAGAALRRVINATGIALHTNLGRAPLPPEAAAALAEAAGYCNLEYDLAAGSRGARLHGVEPVLRDLTGAEAAVAVNNGAAAVLLALAALAAGGEVVVSRGELVEIGGGFRIPDVIRQSGAVLVEVGTTNRTRVADYAAAITPATRMILKVHQSNYRIVGFTAEASLAELAPLARARGVLLMDDLGSGTLQDLSTLGRPHERTVREALADGADLVAFSGDKLLGGPQAGLVVGRDAAVAPLRRHPLMRALRLDKMTLAALEATLRLHRDPATAAGRIPALRMLAQTVEVLHARAEHLLALLQAALPGLQADIVPTEGQAGGGSLPTDVIASRAVGLAPSAGADELARRLRTGSPAVVGRLHGGQFLLDMLAVTDAELPGLATAVGQALR